MSDTPADEFIFNEALVVDPDEANELADATSLLLTDDEIKGARFLVRSRSVEPIENGYAVALDVEFDPPPHAKFTYARVSIKLGKPENLVFAGAAPTEVRDTNPVKIVLTKNLGLKLKAWKVEAGTASHDRKSEYTWYDCLVRGTGAGSNSVRWTFEENEEFKKGIGITQVISFTVSTDEPIEISVQTTCNIIRPGLQGLADRTRTLIFGDDESTGRRRTHTISPPPRESKGWFFGLG